MHNAKSYMVPKLIFANVLAVIMMTFESHAPAEMQDKSQQVKPQKVMGDQPGRVNTIQTGGMMKVADTSMVEASETSVQKQPAVAKKRMHNARHANAKAPSTHFIHAKSAPVDCCFRGYRS